MPYTPTNYVNDNPPALNAGNLNHAETGIQTATATAEAAIAKAIVDAKGDLLVATAADTVARLPVGVDGQALVADSSQSAGVKWGSVAAVGAADYALSVSGGTVTAVGGAGLATVSGTDAGSVLNTCITNLGSSGGTISFQRGTYNWNSVVPDLPTNLNAPLRIIGNGALIALATGARRFLDVGRTGAGQTLRYIEVGGFVIDGGGLGGKHSVIGTLENNSEASGDVSIDQLWIHDLRVTNVPSSNTGTTDDRRVIRFYNPTSSTVSWTNILIQRCRMVGGDYGISIVGASVNTTMDNIIFEDCYHDRNLAPNGGFPSNNFFIGSQALVDRCYINRCVGKQAGDDGVEIDQARRSIVSDSYMENFWNYGFFATNIEAAADVNEQRYIWRNCHAKHTAAHGARGIGFLCGPVNSNPVGSYEMYGCTYERLSTAEPITGETEGGFYFDSTSAAINKIVIENFRHVRKSLTWASAGTVFVIGNNIHLPTGKTALTIRDLVIDTAGTRTINGSNNVTTVGLRINAADLLLNIDGIDYSHGVTNQGTNFSRAMTVGEGAGITTQKINGTIRNARVITITGGDTTPRFATVNENNTATILASTSRLRWVDCDFSNFPGTAGEIFVGANSQNFVHFEHIRWDTYPVLGSSITVTASPFTYTNADGYAELVTVYGGTVSAIDIAPDGTTFTTSTLGSGAFQIDPGAAIKVTYSAAPTMKKVPVK